jgi:hypothetical protein
MYSTYIENYSHKTNNIMDYPITFFIYYAKNNVVSSSKE